MKTSRCHFTQIFFVLFLPFLFANFVEAETTNCTAITSLPYTISTQGIYCLTGNLETNMNLGFAIDITTNNVVLDLNGFKIGGLAAGTGTGAYGIHALSRKNITIRNGTVRGFFQGIFLGDSVPYTTSQGHLIEDIRADMNTFIGIEVFGRGNIIRNNQVVNTGGSTLALSAYGIIADGPGARVLNNDVIETKEQSTGYAWGVYLVIAPGSVVENNRIGNSSLGPGTSYGIDIFSSTDVLVSNNRVTTMNYGVYYDSTSPASTGKYRDNLTSGCTTPFTAGAATDAGGNN
jgi:hypothetical protein